MRTIRVYEPALCCNTGVCGGDPDQALVDFTADLTHLRGLGADIERHNLATDPGAFADNDTVRSYLQLAGSAGLPLTLVDGVTVMTGSYPTRGQLIGYADLSDAGAAPVTVPAGAISLGLGEASDCGCGPGECC